MVLKPHLGGPTLIGRLSGTVAGMEGSTVLLDVHGVGYEVTVAESTLMGLTMDSAATLWTRQIVREDSVSLYGFVNPTERTLFDLLLSVKGCGPKVALSLLGTLGDSGTLVAITSEDGKALARANGVGLRLAERIIVELRDKAAEASLQLKIARREPTTVKEEDEVVDALLALGYRPSEARQAAGEANAKGGTLEERIRMALSELRK